MALLAMSYALHGEVEEACLRGRQAVDLVVGLDSVRALSYVRDLLRSLEPHASAQAVGEFRDYAAASLPGLRRT